MKRVAAGAVVIMFFTACGEDPDTAPFVIAWNFASGDCVSNGVQRVRVAATPEAGAAKQGEAACSDGGVDLGVVEAGSYGVKVEGMDGTGKVVAANFGNSTSFGESGPFGELEVTLHPTPADVVVSWTMSNGGKCPPNVVLPYFIAIYRPPAMENGPLTDKVKEVQESCSTGTATLQGVAPGGYIVELDSRAVTPKVHGTQPVTVKAGEPAQVSFQF